ncbi:MAG: tetratricopeptide repeat protein [Alistipes sp.]|nr:tetratricopeptide repeat protein [Alistipes sp.]
MRRTLFIFTLAAAAFVASVSEVAAQSLPERSLVRKGNRQFGRERYEKSVDSYTRALEAAPNNFEATYNLSNALFRSERYDKAEQTMMRAAADSTRTDTERAEAFFNLGNTQFMQKKLQEALESYKNSLRLNPSDMEAKYNYAYTKRLLEQQQNQENQDDKDNKDDKQDGQQDKDKQQGDGKDNNDNGQNDDRDSQGDDKQQNSGQDDDRDGQDDNGGQDDKQGDDSRQSQSGISPEQQEAMLEAIQAQEDKTQEKVKEKQGVIVRSSKNW